MSAGDDFLPPYELALDYFTIEGDRSPGKCDVRGAGREWEWFELMGWGLEGASLILRRRLLLEFEIDITITTQAQLEAFDVFEGKHLKTPASGRKDKSRGLGIYHPRLARAGIGSAVVVRVGQWDPIRGGGEKLTIKFKEYRSPKFILSKPNGSIPGAAKKTPKAKDALDEAIEVETQRNKALTAADASLGHLL